VSFNGLSSDVLKLEVTESAYIEDSHQVIKVVEGLRSKGYIVEMDDFGSGYSSLNMLSEMPVDVLKMDMEFVKNIEHSEKDVQLVNLIINIAKKMEISVVAEGVETEAQLKILKDMGCEIVQGYYFSRPLPASDFEEQILMKND
jgi:EAL domain-containing protein (putative c-di-GMP-specific phosphodiesterase class I)